MTKLDVFSKLVENYARTSDTQSYLEWAAVPDEDDVAVDDEYSDEERTELRRLMQRRKLSPVLKQLSYVQREVLNRRILGHREVDIARDLGMGQPGVSMAFKRAMKRIRVLWQLPTIEWEEWERVIAPYVELCVKDKTEARKARVRHRVRVLYTLYCTSSYQQTTSTEDIARGTLRQYAYQLRDILTQQESAVSASYLKAWRLLLDNLGCRANGAKTRPNGRETRQEAQCG